MAIVWQNLYFLIFIFQPAYHAIEKNRPSRTSQSHSNKSPRFLDSQPSEWTNIIPQIPQRKDQNPNDYTMIGTSFSYTGNFVFYGLTPSTQYEVIIQSRNREGWSDATDIFRFNTRSQGRLRVLKIKMLTNLCDICVVWPSFLFFIFIYFRLQPVRAAVPTSGVFFRIKPIHFVFGVTSACHLFLVIIPVHLI